MSVENMIAEGCPHTHDDDDDDEPKTTVQDQPVLSLVNIVEDLIEPNFMPVAQILENIVAQGIAKGVAETDMRKALDMWMVQMAITHLTKQTNFNQEMFLKVVGGAVGNKVMVVPGVLGGTQGPEGTPFTPGEAMR